MSNPHNPEDKWDTDFFDVLEALEATIATGDSMQRTVLAKTIDSYVEDHREEVSWATGAQAPSMLFNLLLAINCACRPNFDHRIKPRRPMRTAKRKSRAAP